MLKQHFKNYVLLLLLSLLLAACSSVPKQTVQAPKTSQSKERESEVPLNEFKQDVILAEKQLELPFSYVKSSKIYDELLLGYPAKTLVLRLKQPQTAISSLSGWQNNVLAVGNHSSGPASWPLTHKLGLEAVKAKLANLLELNPQTTLFLFTGASMDNLVYVEKEALQTQANGETFLSAPPLKVAVLVTAGVQTNALRAGRDSGNYWEPGTINIIILSNRKLSPGAMSNMLITATEAKTAALEDLDVRSSASGLPATGTGTDNIIVLSGQGMPAQMSGGHTKLGELLTKAVYEATVQAIAKQNHLTPNRPIGLRLAERGINLKLLLEQSNFVSGLEALNKAKQKTPPLNNEKMKTLGENLPKDLPDGLPEGLAESLREIFQKTIQSPRYAGFIASALNLADAEERGLLPDTSIFSEQCLLVAGELAGRPLQRVETIISSEQLSPALQQALNAVLTGIYYQNLAI